MTDRNMPRITVTIPTYNRAHLLPDAIRSVLEQSVTDLEVFVSDNASTDDTASVVASFEDPRIHYVRNETNVGHLANMSKGFRLGTAPFVTILPDDDVMLPGNLERKVALLEQHPDVGLAHSSAKLVHVGQDNEVLRTNVNYTGGEQDAVESASRVLRKMIGDSYWINFPTAVIRRSYVGDARFESADGLADDLGVFLRLVHRMDSIAYIAEPLVALRMHAETVSTDAGFHEFHGAAFIPTYTAIANIKNVRERFLSQHGASMYDATELRASSRRWIRGMLLQVAKWRADPEQPASANLRLLAGAMRIDPGVIATREGVRLFVTSVVGSKGRSVIRRIAGKAGRQSAQRG